MLTCSLGNQCDTSNLLMFSWLYGWQLCLNTNDIAPSYHRLKSPIKLSVQAICKRMSLFCLFFRFGSTPLHQAAYFGHFDCASVLLASGALANVEEAWGQTPLFLAAQRAHRFVDLQILPNYCLKKTKILLFSVTSYFIGNDIHPRNIFSFF